MNCVRCGCDIPDHVQACPACGLKIVRKTPESPSSPGEWPTVAGPQPPQVPTRVRDKRKIPVWAIILVIAALVVVGISAGVYFMTTRKSARAFYPENVIQQYFDAALRQDWEKVNGLRAPNFVESGADYQMLSLLVQKKLSFKSLKFERLSETETEAHLKIAGFDVSAAEEPVGTDTLGFDPYITFGLVKLNGEWLIRDFSSKDSATAPPPPSG